MAFLRSSAPTVGRLLKTNGFSLQSTSKTLEGLQHPDRDAQFQHINAAVNTALAEHQPVISVDTKKKELVGDFKNGGREYRPAGDPEKVRVHDFLIKELGRAVPYGVYDLAANAGWVNLGIDHDTALMYDSEDDAVTKIVKTLHDPAEQERLRRVLTSSERFSTANFVERVRTLVDEFR